MHPFLVDLGFFQLPTYGVLLVIGIGLGLYLARRRAVTVGIDGDRVFDLALWVVLWGLAGSKLLLIITEPAYLSSLRSAVGLLRAGGVFYGGLIGALLAAVVLLRRYKLPFLPVTDVLVPSLALGHFFGRLGCFSAGCCYGAACEQPWAVVFSSEAAHELSGTPLHVPIHPTQLYEAAFNLANYAFLAWLFRRRLRPGTVLAAYLISYGIGRFVIEEFRGDLDRGFVLAGALSTSQAITLAMIPLGVGILLWSAWRARHEATPPSPAAR